MKLKLTKQEDKEAMEYKSIIERLAMELSRFMGHNEMEALAMEIGMDAMMKGEYDTSQPVHDAITIISNTII